MTASQTITNNPAYDIKLRGLKVKTPNAYRAWELRLDYSTGEVYEKIISEIGDTSEITKPELLGMQFGLKG